MVHRLSFLIALTAACATTSSSPSPPERSDAHELRAPLPLTPVLTLDRQTTALGAALQGRPALVSLWATWCDACKSELDALERLHARARERGGVVVGVAIGEPRDKVAEFVLSHGLHYEQLVDEDFALADALGERKVPTTLVVDRGGRVVFVGGALDEKALAAFRAHL